MLKGVFLEPLPLPQSHQLVFLWERTLETPSYPASFANYRDWKEESRSVQEMGAYLARNVNLTDGGAAVRVRGALSTSSLFSVLGVAPTLGRSFSSQEDLSGLPVAIMAHEIWQDRYGGDPEIVGKTVGLDGNPHTVVGVMPPGFRQPDPGSLDPIQIWVPLPDGTEFEPRRSHSYQVLGRMAPGTTLEGVREELSQIAEGLEGDYPESNRGAGVRVELAHEVLFGEAGGQLMLILGAALVVLFIATANIASLQIARASSRKGEMAVRGALGGSRSRILRQLLTENLLLALVGGILSLLVAWWTLGVLVSVVPQELPRAKSVHLDGSALFFSLAVSIGAGVLFGLAPALSGARVKAAEVLKGEGSRKGGGGGGIRVQSVFIMGQLALSLVLANAALLLLQSYEALRENELGFSTDNVLTMELALRGDGYSVVRGRAEFYEELLPRLKGLPGVVEVGAATSLPVGERAEVQLVREEDWIGSQSARTHTLGSDRIAGSFFSTLEIPRASGRSFIRGEDDPRLVDSRAIINQDAAEMLWPGQDPLGRRFSRPGDEPRWISVVGVVGNTRNSGLGMAPGPQLYLPYASYPTGTMFLTVRTQRDPTALTPLILEQVREVDPRQAVSQIRTMSDVVAGQLRGREFYTILVAAFAALAFLLSAAGVFGGYSRFVAARIREMGIRMALGSGRADLLTLILRQAGVLAGMGLFLGLGGVFLSREILHGYLFGVGPLELRTLTLGASSLFLVSLLAAALPARRASQIDPAETLRRG
jgi:putative ABC transport system permease protein